MARHARDRRATEPNTWTDSAGNAAPDALLVARLARVSFFSRRVLPDQLSGELRLHWMGNRPGLSGVARGLGLSSHGEGVHDVLAQVCNVNFSALPLDSNPVIMTLMIGVAVLVVPQIAPRGRGVPLAAGPGSEHRYKIWCDPTFGTYLAQSLERWSLNAAVVTGESRHESTTGKDILRRAQDSLRPGAVRGHPWSGEGQGRAGRAFGDGTQRRGGVRGFALWGFGMGPEGPDYMAVGDLSTLQDIPWMPGYARLICNGVVNKKPYPYCSRVALQNQIERLAERGLTLYTGIEPEFMLLTRRADGSLGPADPTDTLDKPCYDYKGCTAPATSWMKWWRACEPWASMCIKSITKMATANSRSISPMPTR